MERSSPGFGTKRFGAYLKQVRESRRLSLDAVEEASATYPEPVTKSHLSRIENGRATPSFTRLFALGQIYGVPVGTMAQRFEIELRRDLVPPEILAKPEHEALAHADHLRVSGRYVEALALYSSVLEKRGRRRGAADSETLEIEMKRAYTLLRCGAYEYAKSESEALLGRSELDAGQRVRVLEIVTNACLQLGLYAVAAMTLDAAEASLATIHPPDDFRRAHLVALRARLAYETGDFAVAETSFDTAANLCALANDPMNAHFMRINRGGALVHLDRGLEALPILLEACSEAEARGFERHLALALSHLAKLEAGRGGFRPAEAYAIRSNSIARARDYVDIVFRNCYLLRDLARRSGDEAAVRMNEKTLRTYAHRVEGSLPEAKAFLSEPSRGDA